MRIYPLMAWKTAWLDADMEVDLYGKLDGPSKLIFEPVVPSSSDRLPKQKKICANGPTAGGGGVADGQIK